MRREPVRAVARVVVLSIAGFAVLAIVTAAGDESLPLGAYVAVVVAFAGAEVLRADGRRHPPDLEPVGSLVARRDPPRTRRAVPLAGWEALVESSLISGRAVRVRLQPRLRELAVRRLAAGAGVDAAAAPERASAALAPAEWVLERDPAAPVPAPDDPGIDLDRLEEVASVLERLAGS